MENNLIIDTKKELDDFDIDYENISKEFKELLTEYKSIDRLHKRGKEIYLAPHSRTLRKVRLQMTELIKIFEEYPLKIEKYYKNLPKTTKTQKKNNNLKGGTNKTETTETTENNDIFSKTTQKINFNFNNDTLSGLTEIEPKNDNKKKNKYDLEEDKKFMKEITTLLMKLKKYNPNEDYDIPSMKTQLTQINIILDKIDNEISLVNPEDKKILKDVYKNWSNMKIHIVNKYKI